MYLAWSNNPKFSYFNYIYMKSKALSIWSRLSSLWPLLYGTSCCFINIDFNRYGLVPRLSPIQIDLILTTGTVKKSSLRLYKREQKYVIAGMFSTDSYNTVGGIDTRIPVDIYFPSCPPKTGTKLCKKKIYEDRIKSQQKNHYQSQVSCWT